MIQADHKKWARLIFNPFIERLLRKHFSSFYTIDEIPDISVNGTLIIQNHISWWDGFFIDFLNRHFWHKQFHIMMLEHQLARYWFFQKLGAFSIAPGSGTVEDTFDYTAELMKERHNMAVMFPEGRIAPGDMRPIEFQGGALSGIVERNSSFTIQPVAFRIQYFEEMKPEIIVAFGRPVSSEEYPGIEPMEKDYRHLVDRLDTASYDRLFITDLFRQSS